MSVWESELKLISVTRASISVNRYNNIKTKEASLDKDSIKREKCRTFCS